MSRRKGRRIGGEGSREMTGRDGKTTMGVHASPQEGEEATPVSPFTSRLHPLPEPTISHPAKPQRNEPRIRRYEFHTLDRRVWGRVGCCFAKVNTAPKVFTGSKGGRDHLTSHHLSHFYSKFQRFLSEIWTGWGFRTKA